MKLINFIRSLVKEGAKGPEILAKALADNGSAFKTGDKYAIPAIEDDAVLFRFEQGLKELSGLEIRASGKEIQVAVDVRFLCLACFVLGSYYFMTSRHVHTGAAIA